MSYKFLENIMRTLVNSGLVISSKGKTGGFSLSRPPREINVKEILSVTEGSLAPVSCIEHSELCHCLNDCHALKMWNGLYSAMTGYLEAVNLESLIKTDR